VSTDTYFIKPGYRPNLVQATLDPTDDPDYWNSERIATAHSFQYDVYKLAARQLSDLDESRVLDVGCGPPLKLAELIGDLTTHVQLIDQPNTADLAASIMPEARFAQADLETIDLDLGCRFDIVICADVIEHLLDPDPCIGFIRRHLKPSGRLFISTPERDVLQGRGCMHSPHPMHVREWNRREFAQLLESRCFAVEKQLLLPQRRTSIAKRVYGEIMKRLGFPPRWYSCQLAICRLVEQ
jgi:SAM-dependent methyltransferase